MFLAPARTLNPLDKSSLMILDPVRPVAPATKMVSGSGAREDAVLPVIVSKTSGAALAAAAAAALLPTLIIWVPAFWIIWVPALAIVLKKLGLDCWSEGESPCLLEMAVECLQYQRVEF
jgi:hypothetical protein